MADKFLSKTALTYYHNRINQLFADEADLQALETKVDGIIAEGGEPNVIESITVNGTAVTPDANKNVALTSPTKVSDLTNDSGFQTQSDVQSAIDTAVSSAYTYKWSIATINDLPASGNKTGDVYDVQATGMNYAWDGTKWDAMGQYVDTSVFMLKTDMVAITTAEIDELFS